MQTRGLLTVVLLSLAAVSTTAAPAAAPPADLAPYFSPPAALAEDFGGLRSPLKFDDGRPVKSLKDWEQRRGEIQAYWQREMGQWPPPLLKPKTETLEEGRRENFTQRKLRLEVAPGRQNDVYLLLPEGKGPFPAMLVVYYDPETGVGLGKAGRDFAYQLVKRGFVTLSVGSPYQSNYPSEGSAPLQPLSYLAYMASNCYNALANLPEVDPKRVGVMGHSYGGKWAMFASCLDERFACGVWSDPGIVFDEARSNVNYWEPWYLGYDPALTRKPGILTPESPRTGAYKRLIAAGRDLHELHALMAPRPFLVSGGAEDTVERWKALNHAVAVNKLLGYEHRVAMTNRPAHDPTPKSNEQIYRFCEWALKPGNPSGTK